MAFRQFEDVSISRRSLLRGGAWLGAGAALSGLPMGAAFGQAGASATSWTNVAALVNKYAGNPLANMVATLGWGQQAPEVIAKGTLALGQAAPAGIDSLYRIYSMTKPITGMAAMMLIDAGKLGLDQPLADILPAFANMRVQKTPDGSITETVPADRPITIRHLLTHTAGLGYGIIQKGPIVQAYNRLGLVPGQVSRLPIPGFPAAAAVSSLEVFADRLATLPLVYQPGTTWSYSMSLDLLGRVIEVVSGVPFDEFLATNIFQPCGMSSTWFQVPKSEAGRLTTNYAVLGNMLLPIDPAAASVYTDRPPFPAGGAGLVSSPRDYDRFLRMLAGYGVIDGQRVMGELAVRVGTANLLPDTVDTKNSLIKGAGFGAGGRVGIGEEAGTYGWGGAAGTVALVHMKIGLRAALYTQYMPADAFPMHQAFPAALLADVAALRR